MLPIKFQVSWPLGSGEEAKNRLSKWHHGGHLGLRIGMILAIFDLQVTQILPTKFQSIGLSIQEKKILKYFQDDGHGGHLDFIGMLLASFHLLVTSMPQTKFQVK